MQSRDGHVLLGQNPATELRAAIWDPASERWQPLQLREQDGVWEGACELGHLRLNLSRKQTHATAPGDSSWSYLMILTAPQPTRARLELRLPGAKQAYPILPGFSFGDNNLQGVTAMRFPHLTAEKTGLWCSPYWECRADRCSHPLAMVACDAGVVGISVDPYSDDALPKTAAGHVTNGLCVHSGDADSPPGCGVTLGYRNQPGTYHVQGELREPTEDRLVWGTARGSISCLTRPSRRGVHELVRAEHQRLSVPAEPSTGTGEASKAIEAVTSCLCTAGWDSDAETFGNGNWSWERSQFVYGRPSHEIAWTGGLVVAYPLLLAGLRHGNAGALGRSRRLLDRVANAISPDSGFYYDSVDKTGQGSLKQGWWAFYELVPAQHYAYLNGQAAFYALAACEVAQGSDTSPLWKASALRVLSRAVEQQAPDGRFGIAFDAKTGAPTDFDGFAGCWFAAACALAYRLTGSVAWRQAADRAIARYARDVDALNCYGTPLDTHKAVDQEGVLAFIRATRIMHQITGEPSYLDYLERGLEYEYLWRYAFRSRPLAKPLAGSPYNSKGGSITSVCNPHVHPMAGLSMGDSDYLASQTGDAYHKTRLREMRDYMLTCLALYPRWTGHGSYGTTTERFCPSDGLLIERFPDSTPASIWFTHHGWAAANILEGLLDIEP